MRAQWIEKRNAGLLEVGSCAKWGVTECVMRRAAIGVDGHLIYQQATASTILHRSIGHFTILDEKRRSCFLNMDLESPRNGVFAFFRGQWHLAKVYYYPS